MSRLVTLPWRCRLFSPCAKLLPMMTVREIASRLGLSEWAARRLLYACRPLLNGLQGYGSHGEWLINPQAIPILERAKELRAQGIRLQELCTRLAQEMGQSRNGSPSVGEQACASREQGDAQALIEALQQQIAHLREENAWLRAKLDEALARIPALPAPARLSRWQALKIALLGHG